MVIALIGGGAGAARATGTSGATTPGVRTPKIKWGPCGEAEDPSGPARRAIEAHLFKGLHRKRAGGIECGTLAVPLDHRRPHGERISLAVTRIRGTAKNHSHLGPLLVNPGGPGASGVWLPEYVAATLPEKVSRRFDIIGFDPRGVANSRPALSCTNPKRFYRPPMADYVPRNRSEERALRDRAKGYAEGCDRRHGRLLKHMTTRDHAHDVDAIRKALGEKRISFFGYSYGAYLGAIYASRYPRRIRRLVMDSVVDPGKVWYDANIDQHYAFDARHREFLAWVAANHRVYRIGRTPKQVEFAFYAMRSRLRERPIEGEVGPSELDETFITGGYTNMVWPQLAHAFSAYTREGDEKPMQDAFRDHGRLGAEDENGYGVYLAVECTDNAWPRKWSRWRSDAQAVHRGAPFMAWQNTWYNAPCATWPAPAKRPVPIKGRKLPPILMVQSKGDAATPYHGALNMRKRLPTARLIVDNGGNHGSSLSGNRCVDKRLARYLAHGTVPKRRVTCPALPAPGPGGSGPNERRVNQHAELIGHLRGR